MGRLLTRAESAVADQDLQSTTSTAVLYPTTITPCVASEVKEDSE